MRRGHLEVQADHVAFGDDVLDLVVAVGNAPRR